VGFAPSNYQNEIEEYLVPYSTAKFGARKINGKRANGFICGARARVGLFADYLNPRTEQLLLKNKLKIGVYNPFFNNLAQAIEISHFIEEAMLIIDRLVLIIEGHQNTKFKPQASVGVGVVEAPRGLLYHKYEFDNQGLIRTVDIITPTVQNLSSIEDDIAEFIIQNRDLAMGKKTKIIEMLIRAFDPCITCSVH
jgi:coenzyme F420-reducing hydrogenase alpha subunit